MYIYYTLYTMLARVDSNGVWGDIHYSGCTISFGYLLKLASKETERYSRGERYIDSTR